ncbi:MAG: hypothetical protein HZB98_05840, partial [Bacteroidia bacterium]|nr:hypothetical protein [Bacteroidia bacterium]
MKLKVIVYYSFIQLLLTASTASGQKILYPVLNPANSRFDNLEIDYGRGGATVYSLLQDNRGFIWCGTDGGLYRYDGTRYIRFYYGDSDTTIYGNIALSMLNDNSGAMWVGTHGGLSLIHQDKRQISHFIPDTANLKSADNSIRLIRKDKKGNIWLLTDWNIFRLDHDTHIFRKFATDTLPLHSIEVAFTEDKDKFIEDNNGYIWIATNKGLFQYNYDSDQWKKIYPSANAAGNINPRVNCIKADNNGDLWFGTEYDGLFRIIEPEKGLYEHILMITREGLNNEVAPITSVLTGDDEDLWFTTDTTLCRINILNRKMTEYIFSDAYGNPRNWKKSSRLTRMIRGSGDEIWLLNYVNGIVFKFNSDTEKSSSYMVPRFIVFDALLDSTGNLWTGCVASNIFILVTSGLPYVSRTIPNITGVSLSNSQLLEEDSQGNIIVLTNNSIIKLNNTVDDFGLIPEKSSELNYKDLKPLCIFRDSKLNLWLSFSDGIIRKYDPDDRLIRNYLLPVEMNNIPENSIKFIREDSNGNLWFASFDGDIFILPDKVSEISLAIRTDELTNEKKITEILDFNIDMENQLWISTLKN